MDRKYERWAATGTGAVVVAVAAATWAMCENWLAWRETFRLEELTFARGQVDDFEAYRPGGPAESAPAWVAAVVLFIAVVVATVAGVRARRWPPTIAALGAFCGVAVTAIGAALPLAAPLIPVVAVGATLVLRDFARPAPQTEEAHGTS